MWFLWVLLSVPIAVVLVIFFGHMEIEMNDTEEMLDELKDKAHDITEPKKSISKSKSKSI